MPCNPSGRYHSTLHLVSMHLTAIYAGVVSSEVGGDSGDVFNSFVAIVIPF